VAGDVVDASSISLGEVVRRLSVSRRFVPLCGLLGLVVGVVFWLVLPRSYVSQATLLPSSGDEGGGFGGELMGLAGTLGLAVPGSAVPESHLYPAILKSERIIRNALDTLVDPADSSRGDLRTVINAGEDLLPEETVLKIRKEILRVSLDEATGIVRVSLVLGDPELAARANAIFLSELSEYLRQERSASSRENREFIEGRQEESSRELRDAEEALRAFRDQNRNISNSPDLLMEEARLLRAVRVQEELFLELTRQFEIARIEEKKATPILEILDPPEPHYVPHSPRLPIWVGICTVVGILLGSLLAVVFEDPVAAGRGVLTSARSLFGADR
jgi:uncharacterized protein involved in exopolysaccharide biosynthesis